MARPKKLLAMQEGNLTCKQQEEKRIQEEAIQTGMEQLDKPPKWLRDKEAKKEWKRLVEQFKRLAIISNLDLNNLDRKSTRLNSSHANISYAVFCLKKKKNTKNIYSY